MSDPGKHPETVLHGVIPAIITPLHKDGKINDKLLEKQVSYLSNAGVHGFLVNGTTGEGPFLSMEEKKSNFEFVRAFSKGRQFLCLGCLLPSTDLTIDEIRTFEPFRPDFVVVTSPYYFKVSQKEIVSHIREIATQSPFPVIVYNIPQCTHNKIELQAMIEIASMDNVVGFKDSSGDFISFSRVLFRSKRENFAWIMGEDYLDADALAIGAKGVVTGLGNVWIEPYLEMYEAAKRRDFATARQHQEKINAVYEVIQTVGGRGIPAVKAGAALLGRSEKWVKSPVQPLNEDELSRVANVLAGIGLEVSR